MTEEQKIVRELEERLKQISKTTKEDEILSSFMKISIDELKNKLNIK